MFRIIVLVFIVGATFSCGKINNSSSLDKIKFASSSPSGTTLFNTMNSIISNKCSTCHPAWISFTADDFISAGLVTAQSIATSKLYYRNQNAAIGPGPQNMPSNGLPALTESELQSLADWINSL